MSFPASSLYKFCELGDKNTLEKNKDFIKMMSYGHRNEALLILCKNNYNSLVFWYIDNFDIDFNFRFGIFLSMACINNNQELYDYFKTKVTIENIQFFTYACRGGNLDMAKEMLKYIDSSTERKPYKYSNIEYSLYRNKYDHIYKMIIECSINGHVYILKWFLDEIKFEVEDCVIKESIQMAYNKKTENALKSIEYLISKLNETDRNEWIKIINEQIKKDNIQIEEIKKYIEYREKFIMLLNNNPF